MNLFLSTITVTYKLERCLKYHAVKKNNKVWEKRNLNQDLQCIIIGIRTLSNGITEYDSDGFASYTPTEHFKALLVVSSINDNPFYVLMSDYLPTQLKDSKVTT